MEFTAPEATAAFFGAAAIGFGLGACSGLDAFSAMGDEEASELVDGQLERRGLGKQAVGGGTVHARDVRVVEVFPVDHGEALHHPAR